MDNPAGQNPLVPPTITPAPVPEKPKFNFWKLSTIILLLMTLGAGAYYFLSYRKAPAPKPTSSPNAVQPTAEPVASALPTDSSLIKSNQIVLGGVLFTFPDTWTPIFTSPADGKKLVYFARDEQEAQALAGCAANDCSGYLLRLEDFSDYAVWQNSTIEDFIKQVKKDIPFDNLQKTTINGRDAWLGYTDAKKNIHQALIDTSTALSKSLTVITASTANPDGGMLEKYVTLLPSIKIVENKSVKPEELAVKKGFVIEMSSSLPTNDYWVLEFILHSLLSPQNSTRKYQYFLFTESAINSQSAISGPTYPGGNFLNAKYYLLTDNDRLSQGTYGTSQVQIKLSTPPTAQIGQFLADPKYCRQDSDCQYRVNFCTIGAFNPYHQFYTPWGCGPANLEGLGNTMELQEKLGCGYGIDVKAQYDSLQCVNNSCQIINAKPVCKQ